MTMQVPLISMPRIDALKKVAAYQRAVRRSKDPALAAAEVGYSALAKGRTLLDLHLAVAAGGWTPAGHPRFAVARADRRTVEYEIERPWLRFRSAAHKYSRANGPGLFRSVALAAMPPQQESWKSYRRAQALVPLIPADVREEARRNSSFLGERSWFILWEAVWQPLPPRDPILLEHVGGSLYAVLAQWELTELERALMAGALYGDGS